MTAKPAFNPQQPFEKTDSNTKPSFNPSEAFEVGEGGPGAGQSFLEHYGNAATFGYLPQAQAGLESVLPDPNSDLNARLRAAGFTIDEPGNDYVTSRDANIARLAQEGKSHPTASTAGTGAGIVGNAVLTGGALKSAGLVGKGATLAGGLEGPVTQGAARLKNYLDAARVGAVMGAVSNPGDATGELNPIQLPQRIEHMGMGVPIGVAGQGVSEAIQAVPGAAQYLRSLANEKAFKVLGAGKRAFKEAFGKDQVQSLGRQALDEGFIGPLTTPKSLAARVEAAKDAAGAEIGGILDRVDEDGAKRLAQQQINRTEAQDFLERYAGVKTPKPNRIDTGEIADSLAGGGEAQFLSKTPGMEGASSKFQGALDTLRKNGDVTLREAQALRQGIDKSINFGKRVPEMSGAQQGLYEIRDAIRNKMNDVVNESADIAASGQKDALLKANRRYSALSTMDKILDDKIAGDAARRTYSLGDHLSSGTGAAVGGAIAGPPGAVVGGFAGGALSKAARTFGNATQARGYDALADLLSKLPPGVGETLSSNPGELQALISQLQNPGGKALPAQPDGAPNPLLGRSKKTPNRTPSKSSARLKALEE